jgi:integrase/recombinase XerC
VAPAVLEHPGAGPNPHRRFDVAKRTPTDAAVGLSEAVGAARHDVAIHWVSAAQAERVGKILDRFVSYCAQGHDIHSLVGVTRAMASAFVRAPSADGTSPSASAMHLRRNALRLLYRSARSRGLAFGDPTLDLVLPPRSPWRTRPLKDDEVALCRSVSQWSLADTRRASVWAVAEATGRSGELPYVRRRDVDLDHHKVWLRGGKTTAERWGHLTDWGISALARRMDRIGVGGDTPVLYEGGDKSDAGQVSGCIALRDVFERAGVSSDPGVRPASVAAWAGRKALEETGRIDVVAQRLGMRSLDRTARFIGWSLSELETE